MIALPPLASLNLFIIIRNSAGYLFKLFFAYYSKDVGVPKNEKKAYLRRSG